MAAAGVTRKLTAILYADVVGYSRLTGADELGTHHRLSAALDLISDEIGKRAGRVVHYAGDAVLAEFGSVVAAVESAVTIQRLIAESNANVPDDMRLQLRIGVNLGEVIVDRDDIYGDGVNVAARLESLAEPGGICISGSVHEQVEGKTGLAFEFMGDQEVKNIAKPVRAFSVKRPGVERTTDTSPAVPDRVRQAIRFCTTPDGTNIAYAAVGEGTPIVKTANYLNHLDYDWESPVWRHVLRALAEDHCLIRYDQRGNGLSDWEVADISFEAWVQDLETVVDAAGLERFSILGISQGCSLAIEYAVRHPERVSRLVLYGGYTRGRNKRGSAVQIADERAMTTLIKTGWGRDNPAFRQLFTSLFMPDASPEQMQWFNELQRRTTNSDNAVRIRQVNAEIEITDRARRVSAATLVMHVRDDGVVPFEEGRRMATLIPAARFVALDGRNHLILEDEPAWPKFLGEVRSFLKEVDNGG